MTFEDIAALLGLRADLAIGGRAPVDGRGAIRPPSPLAGRPGNAADVARIGAVMPAMQLGRLGADLIVSSHTPHRRNEPAEQHACDRPDHTDPSGSHRSSSPQRARASRAPTDQLHVESQIGRPP